MSSPGHNPCYEDCLKSKQGEGPGGRIDDVILGHGYPSGESRALGHPIATAGVRIVTPRLDESGRWGAGAMAWRPCVSGVDRGSRRCSSGPKR